MSEPMTDRPDFDRRVPEGDDHERLVCKRCAYVQYENPKIVTGSVVTWEEKILLCRRAIEPRTGFWTLPAGFLELHETVEAGARREAWEEARARLELDRLLAVYTIEHISQVQMFYRGRLLSPDVSPGPESLEVGLFTWDEIPWDDLAFPTVRWALNDWSATRHLSEFAARSNPPEGGDARLPKRA